jgi:hypothetical protein
MTQLLIAFLIGTINQETMPDQPPPFYFLHHSHLLLILPAKDIVHRQKIIPTTMNIPLNSFSVIVVKSNNNFHFVFTFQYLLMNGSTVKRRTKNAQDTDKFCHGGDEPG